MSKEYITNKLENNQEMYVEPLHGESQKLNRDIQNPRFCIPVQDIGLT